MQTTKSIAIPISHTINRLAYQMETTPEEIINHALRNGLRNIDWNLGNDCDPFADGCDGDYIDITETMDALTPKRFAELCEGEDEPQKTLLEDAMRTQGIEWTLGSDGELVRL